MMRTEKVIILLFCLVMICGYVLVDKNTAAVLTKWQTVTPENYVYELQSLNDAYSFVASNIFDQGYVREIGSQVWQRLSVITDNLFFKEGFFLIPSNYAEGIVKLKTPEGFRDGNLSLKATTDSGFRVGVSLDQKNWQFQEFPGFGTQGLYSLNISKKGFFSENLYLKFLPSQNKTLTIYFDFFQYTANPPVDNKEYAGILFFPEIDIDYEGKHIVRPAIYAKKSPKTNN